MISDAEKEFKELFEKYPLPMEWKSRIEVDVSKELRTRYRVSDEAIRQALVKYIIHIYKEGIFNGVRIAKFDVREVIEGSAQDIADKLSREFADEMKELTK